MLDAHNHLHFSAFDHDRDDVVHRAAVAGVTGMVLAGYDSSRRDLSRRLAERRGIWATAGVHPWAVDAAADDVRRELDLLCDVRWSSFCGLGELGLDFHRASDEAARQRQRSAFREQLAIARDLDLPVVIHCVRANQEVARILQEDGMPGRGGIIHSFWGSAEEARRFVELGLYLSIGTQITRSVGEKMAAAVKEVTLERLMVETDAPDRPPADVESSRNEPAYLSCVVESLALVLGVDRAHVRRVTEDNARSLFELGEETLRDSDE